MTFSIPLSSSAPLPLSRNLSRYDSLAGRGRALAELLGLPGREGRGRRGREKLPLSEEGRDPPQGTIGRVEGIVKDDSHAILLFDGECSLCDAWVQWVVRHDQAGKLKLASLQSQAAQSLLAAQGIAENRPDSVLLLDQEGVHSRSEAVIRILQLVPEKAWLARLLSWIPSPLREGGYRMVAANRKKLLGKRESCLAPTPGVKSRFLDADERWAPASPPQR